MREAPFAVQLRLLLEKAKQALDAAIQCADVVAGTIPRPTDADREPVSSLKDGIPRLVSELIDLRDQLGGAFDRIWGDPYTKLVYGRPLSEEQYYFLRAAGIAPLTAQSLGISAVSDHEIMTHLWYEDENWSGYINPGLGPPDPPPDELPHTFKTGLRFGMAPEQLSRRMLRPEQLEFLARWLPHVLYRFGD